MDTDHPFVQNQLNHRSIRAYTEEPLAVEMLETLLAVARRTATSSSMQACSIIRVTETHLKHEIAAICKQDFVSKAPELFIFIVDQYRNQNIAQEKGHFHNHAAGMDSFFQSFTDAALMAQNVVNAAQALGLGTVYLGSIHNDSTKMCQILKLPQLTFPVVGLIVGYAAQEPQQKPRLENHLRVFENCYTVFDNYLHEIQDYDEIMQSYYDLRNASRRVDSFSDQVVKKLSNPNPKRQEILKAVRAQGFLMHLSE